MVTDFRAAATGPFWRLILGQLRDLSLTGLALPSVAIFFDLSIDMGAWKVFNFMKHEEKPKWRIS